MEIFTLELVVGIIALLLALVALSFATDRSLPLAREDYDLIERTKLTDNLRRKAAIWMMAGSGFAAFGVLCVFFATASKTPPKEIDSTVIGIWYGAKALMVASIAGMVVGVLRIAERSLISVREKALLLAFWGVKYDSKSERLDEIQAQFEQDEKNQEP